jgi:hypothetical protein
MISLLAAGVLSPFFLEVAPEVRTTYVSLGKLVEDRPMQMTFARVGCDAGGFGRFGIRSWSVSSLTDRRQNAHRHAFYHVEFGPTWQYSFDIADGWRVASELTRSWTLYRGFDRQSANRTYHWWEVNQSLENQYLVPYYRFRCCFRGSEYLWFRVGLRRRFPIFGGLYATPSVYADGGDPRNSRRVFGEAPDGCRWRAGVSSVTFRLELGWKVCESMTAFAFVEQYEIVGGDERRATDVSSYRCSRSDWTLGGMGMRFSF